MTQKKIIPDKGDANEYVTHINKNVLKYQNFRERTLVNINRTAWMVNIDMYKSYIHCLDYNCGCILLIICYVAKANFEVMMDMDQNIYYKGYHNLTCFFRSAFII